MSRTVCALLLAAAAVAPSAHAKGPRADRGAPQAISGSEGSPGGAGVRAAWRSPLLWATINTCDTPGSPNEMGVRASMPGNGHRQRMYMRFRAQYRDAANGRWVTVRGRGVSPWVYVGSARYRSRQAGWTFRFDPPAAGTTYMMRGIVEYQWRALRRPRRIRRRRTRGAIWRVVARRLQATVSGVPGVRGGDPEGTSKALCVIY
jgi:hypothetical protein